MTITAQLPDRPQAGREPADRPTLGIDSGHRSVVDVFALLDHRTRARAISERGAPPGRYLSVEGDGETLLVALQRPITHIGRGLVADVRLQDAHVSRRHAIVALRGDGARVLDDRSANGTFVNGHSVSVAYLADGDVLRFGRVVLRYVEIAPSRADPPLRRLALARRGRRRAVAVALA